MAGPKGDIDNDRAGEPGEYHHSKNLIKKIAVGNRSLNESSNNCGDRSRSLRTKAKNPFFLRGIAGGFTCASCQDGECNVTNWNVRLTKSSMLSLLRSTPTQASHGR
jgi:hypothetical protein